MKMFLNSLLFPPLLSLSISPRGVIGLFYVIVHSGAIKSLQGVETPAACYLVLERTLLEELCH